MRPCGGALCRAFVEGPIVAASRRSPLVQSAGGALCRAAAEEPFGTLLQRRPLPLHRVGALSVPPWRSPSLCHA